MMQIGTMIFSTTTYNASTSSWKCIDVRKGDVGVIVQRWRSGRQKKYLVKFLRNPDESLWALPGTIRRLE